MGETSRGGSSARSRRTFLAGSIGALAAYFSAGRSGATVAFPKAPALLRNARATSVSLLDPPDANGLRLLPGFSSRIVARADEIPAPGAQPWHRAPDGGATFPRAGGGWIYASNSELGAGAGGAGALAFDAAGNVVGCYRILAGTSRNCAGGPTPWGSWLSCEEFGQGRVWECDPRGIFAPIERAAMGEFTHEGVAIDPLTSDAYLTEDQPDGRLYRFRPARAPSLAAGTLDVAQVIGDPTQGACVVVWHAVPQPVPGAGSAATRYQVSASTAFNGGEGICHHEGAVYFTTKGDNRVWAYECSTATLRIVYDDAWFTPALLTGVDNIVVTSAGVAYVAEDGGDMQIAGITADGTVFALLQVSGQPQSEIAGPAFSPDGSRLYFSSQRASVASGEHGVTYEVTGPFDAAPDIAASVFADGFEAR